MTKRKKMKPVYGWAWFYKNEKEPFHITLGDDKVDDYFNYNRNYKFVKICITEVRDGK